MLLISSLSLTGAGSNMRVKMSATTIHYINGAENTCRYTLEISAGKR